MITYHLIIRSSHTGILLVEHHTWLGCINIRSHSIIDRVLYSGSGRIFIIRLAGPTTNLRHGTEHLFLGSFPSAAPGRYHNTGRGTRVRVRWVQAAWGWISLEVHLQGNAPTKAWGGSNSCGDSIRLTLLNPALTNIPSR